MLSKVFLSSLILLQLQQHISCLHSFSKAFSYVDEDNGQRAIYFNMPVRVSENTTALTRLDCDRGKDNCRLIEDIYQFNELRVPTAKRMCNFIFGINKNIQSVRASIAYLNKDSVLIDWVWDVYSHGKPNARFLRKIHLANLTDCKHTDINIKMNASHDPLSHLVPHENGTLFDVFYTDFDLCKQGRCRATYDAYGNIVAGPHCILDGILSTRLTRDKIGTKVVAISNDEYFVLDRNDIFWMGYLLKYKDSSVSKIFESIHQYEHTSISTVHNRITVCWLSPTEFQDSVDCSHFNLRTGQAQDLTLNFPYAFNVFYVHNLWSSEFLVLTNHHTPGDDARKNEGTYDLFTYRSDGNQVAEPTQVRSSTCHAPWSKSKAVISEWGNETCFALACQHNAIRVLGEPGHDKDHFFYTSTFTIKCM